VLWTEEATDAMVEEPPPVTVAPAATTGDGVPAGDPSFPELPPAATDDATGEEPPPDAKKADAKKADVKKADAKKADAKKADTKEPPAAVPAPRKIDASEKKDATPPAAADAKDAAPKAKPDPAVTKKRRVKRYVLRAELALSKGDHEKAGALVEKALKLDPTFARAHRTKALACARRGDQACTRASYEAYLQHAPDAPDAQQVRAILGK
jgi:tetratricopeptide (TPR) repeat protein